MAYDRHQFEAVITRVLKAYGLHSEAAVAILLGTAATESKFGTFFRQVGGGPARGAFQMEPPTFQDIIERYGPRFPGLYGRRHSELETDLELAILTARCKFMDEPSDLPEPDDVAGMAIYHKKFYNSMLGKATPAKFIADWKRYVATT